MFFRLINEIIYFFSIFKDNNDSYDEETAGGFVKEPPKPRQRNKKSASASSQAQSKRTTSRVTRTSRSTSTTNSSKSSRSPSEGPTSVSSASTALTSLSESEDDISLLPTSATRRGKSRNTRSKGKVSRKRKIDDVENSESEDEENKQEEYKYDEEEESDNADSDDDFRDENASEEAEAPATRPNRSAGPRARARARARPVTEEERVAAQIRRMKNTRASWDASLYRFHPQLETIFQDLENEPKIVPTAIEQPEGMTIQLLPFQKEGLHWLIEQEKSRYKGGVLADEMGMGKTIQTIALFMSDKREERIGPNLVIAPAVALMQWKNEIESHAGGSLSVLVYHGKTKNVSKDELMDYDVVLTTYSLVESVYRKQQSGFRRKDKYVKEQSTIHNTKFHRIVLDEAHNVKDRNSNTTRAVSCLETEKRLCLSGTPLQNRVGELYSLIRFLHVTPFCQYFCRKCDCTKSTYDFTGHSCNSCGHFYGVHHNFFNYSLLSHIQRPQAGQSQEAMGHMRLLLKRLMLRRTKLERADDLGLPPRVVEIRRDYFNPEEKDLYESIYSDSSRKFNTYVAQGVVLNNYANIFSLITRMRQLADHPDLVLKRHMTTSGYIQNTLVCQLCDDPAEEPIQSRCHHTFCRLCISEYCESWSGPENELECPVCHIGLSIDLTAPAIVSSVQDEVVRKKSSIINRINTSGGWRSSTKIEALVEELYKLRSNKQTIKSIVFSQFTSMLDLVEWRLNKAGFQTVKLQGSMAPIQRDAIIKHFMSTPSVEIFLVSLKAGGVALNLCEASQVFILDPWWNPSVEWQSGDRVHRIGQHRPVKITRLIIQDSIESRIVELQEKKATMINATINSDDAAMQRLTTADVQFLFQI